jgi:hypothetical protein
VRGNLSAEDLTCCCVESGLDLLLSQHDAVEFEGRASLSSKNSIRHLCAESERRMSDSRSGRAQQQDMCCDASSSSDEMPLQA